MNRVSAAGAAGAGVDADDETDQDELGRGKQDVARSPTPGRAGTTIASRRRAVACSTRVRINHGRTPVRADTVASRLSSTAWQRQSAGIGAKGPRYYDWAWIHIGTDEHRHLLIRRNRTTGELAFHLCWSPTEVPLAELVRVAGIRWSVEECFQAAKGQVGLDHYQARNWTARHRHITLAMLALAFLAAVAADAAPKRPTDLCHPARSSDAIPLTVPEIRHLLAAAFGPPALSVVRLLHW